MRVRRRPLIAVLGASGYVGSAVAMAFSRHPVRLRLVARRLSSIPPGGLARIEACRADLTVTDSLSRIVAGADAVVHLAAYRAGASLRVSADAAAAERVNVGLMHSLTAAIRAGKRDGPPPVLVFAGSTLEVGTPATMWINGTEPDEPRTAYGHQKLASEQALKAATAEGSVRGITLRLPTVFGHCAAARTTDQGVVTAMVRRALAGQPLTMWRDGAMARDLLYLDDTARAFVSALDHAGELAGRHWLLGAGRPIQVCDLFTLIADIVSCATGRPPVPVISVQPPAQALVTDFHDVAVDSSAFRTVTGWHPRVSLREGISRTVRALA
jgi:nucleoside-diphosphate-sugar epimerase